MCIMIVPYLLRILKVFFDHFLWFSEFYIYWTACSRHILEGLITDYRTTKHIEIMAHLGEAWFTLPDVTKLAMPEPGVPFAILSAKYDIVHGLVTGLGLDR